MSNSIRDSLDLQGPAIVPQLVAGKIQLELAKFAGDLGHSHLERRQFSIVHRLVSELSFDAGTYRFTFLHQKFISPPLCPVTSRGRIPRV